MSTIRSASLAILLAVLAGAPALAATCSLTVQGASVLDDETCAVGPARGATRIVVGSYGTIVIRGSAMRAEIAGPQRAEGRSRRRSVSLGGVVTSDDMDGRTCYFGQRAVLCIAR